MPKSPPSARATDHVTMSGLGLLTIPISIYSGTVSDHGIHRSQFVEVPVLDEDGKPVLVKVKEADGTEKEVPLIEDHPVGNKNYDKSTGEVLEPGTEVLRKIKTEQGYVFVEPHEEETLLDISPRSLVIKAFQPQSLFALGHYVPKSLYFVEATKTPGKGKSKVPNVAAQGALGLLFEAMKRENAVALVEFTTRGVPKPGVLLPDGTLWLVHFTEELREQRPLPEVATDPALVSQVQALIGMMWSDEPVDLEDRRSSLIQEFAEEKARQGDFARSVGSEVPDAPLTVPDLSSILAASMAALQGEQRAEDAG